MHNSLCIEQELTRATYYQVRHAWNPDDRSLNIFVKDNDPLSFHRHPVAQSTDSIRGRYRGRKYLLHKKNIW